MFILYGRRNVRIKHDIDNDESCSTCSTSGIDVLIYRQYFHIFFIPIFAAGPKNVHMYCRHCGERKWFKGKAQLYEKATRTPIYFYTGLLLVAALIVLGVVANINTQRKNAALVASPMKGDVYTIRKSENNTTYYYFMRLNRIKGDTVWTLNSNLVYSNYVSVMDSEDFFNSTVETGFTKQQLQEMARQDMINEVHRGYGSAEGFDRVQ